MDQLRLNEGDPIRIWGARFPKGEMVKIQAQSVDFLEVSDPKAVYVLPPPSPVFTHPLAPLE
jgi:ubiquitin fusion degradation protein 1